MIQYFLLQGIAVGDNCLYYISPLTDESSDFLVLTNPEYGLKGVASGSRQLLPFRFTNIQIDKNAGTYNGAPLWKISLTRHSTMTDTSCHHCPNESVVNLVTLNQKAVSY